MLETHFYKDWIHKINLFKTDQFLMLYMGSYNVCTVCNAEESKVLFSLIVKCRNTQKQLSTVAKEANYR